MSKEVGGGGRFDIFLDSADLLKTLFSSALKKILNAILCMYSIMQGVSIAHIHLVAEIC